MYRLFMLPAILLVLALANPLAADEPTRENGRQVADADLEAVKTIEEVGGTVVRDEWREGKPVIRVDLNSLQVTDKLLRTAASCSQLQSLDLWGCAEVTDAGVKELASCLQLQSLNLF